MLNVEMWKYGNVANVASVANTNAQYQLVIGNIGIGNMAVGHRSS